MNILTRRSFLATAALSTALGTRLSAAETGAKGRINHSVCKWCYPKVSVDELCKAGKEFGLTSVELVAPADFPVLKQHGMSCAMTTFPTIEGPGGMKLGTIERAFNRVEHHDRLVRAYEPYITAVADAGFKHLICFSGNRDGMDDATGMKNCAEGLKRLLPLAEKRGVVLVMELLNSRVNHKDYMCDHTAWGVGLCKMIRSENFKLLYDIYHMQIMEGDVIAHIKAENQYYAHYHTGGVPGRNEIDDTQELNYPAIMRAIADTGFKGHVAQEFIPKKPDALASLKQAVGICTV